MTTIQIMLADDHTMMRQGLRAILELEEDVTIIGEASNGEELISKICNGMRPNIVVMDVQMPGMSGIDATQQLLTHFPDIRVIGLTAVAASDAKQAMLNAGASSYLVKSSAADDLVKTIRSVWDTADHETETTHRSVYQRIQSIHESHVGRSRMRGKSSRLTRREIEVMHSLMHGQSNKEIARQLIISERTVQTHLSNIFAKMKVNSRTEAVLMAMHGEWMPSA